MCRESWARKRLPPQFSRLGTQGPASHVVCDFVSVCVGVMGEVWFSFFSYVSFHASVLYTCFSMRLLQNVKLASCTVYITLVGSLPTT